MPVLDATSSLLAMLSRWSAAIDIAQNVYVSGGQQAEPDDPGASPGPGGSAAGKSAPDLTPTIMSPGLLGAADSLIFATSASPGAAAPNELPPVESDDPTLQRPPGPEVSQSLSGLRPPLPDPASAAAWPDDEAGSTQPDPSPVPPSDEAAPAPATMGAAFATEPSALLGTEPALDDDGLALAWDSQADPPASSSSPAAVEDSGGSATAGDAGVLASRERVRPDDPLLAPTVIASAGALMPEDSAARQPGGVDRSRPADPASDSVSEGTRTNEVRLETRTDPASDLPVLRRADASDVDGWSLVGAQPGDSSAGSPVEQTGIIASFILNAAMIPGWPPPRPFEMPTADAFLNRLLQGPKGAPSEEDYLAFLSERGAKPSFLARLRALLDKLSRSRRLRLLLGLTALMSTIEAVLEALEDELAHLGGGGGRDEDESPLEDAEVRRSLTA